MDRTQLLQHFDTLAETPEAVAKLRKLVLDFAIRGRLVPQNPKDAPAVHLVERAKAVLAKERKKTNAHNNGAQAIPPFSLPKNWCWTSLAELGDVAPKNELDEKTEIGFSPMRLVNAKFGEAISFERKAWSEVRKGFTHFADGDVVVAKITPCFQNGKSGVIRGAPNGFGAGTTELHVLRPVANCVLPDYALVFVKSPHFLINGEAHMTGTAGQKRVSWEYFARTPFPLPPLAEQKRIVAKVEELLALCDELEARQTAAREHRARLVGSALDHMTTAKDESDFKERSAFCLQHSELLFDSVPTLRQAILSLAVQGRLATQDANGEAAHVLLKRITSEKAKALGKGGAPSPLYRFSIDDIPFELPHGWEWIQAQGLCSASSLITYGILKPVWVEEGVLTVRVQDMKGGGIKVDAVAHCSRERAEKFTKTLLEAGDLLIAKDGATLGKTAFVPPSLAGGNITQHVLRFPISRHVFRPFIRLVIDSPHGQAWMRTETKGVALPGVNVGDFRKMPIPVPPLAEQQRIVAKVDELMRWCDALEARLTAAQTTATHLLDATLHQILKPAA